MDFALFSAVFILQFVGHRIGDFIFQTDNQALFKTTSEYMRMKHCIVYATTVSALTLFALPLPLVGLVWGLTFMEHMIIDDRRFVLWWKTFLETKIVRRKDFDIKNVPGFVIIEIDQTIHMVRMMLIAMMFAYLL